MVFPLTCFGCLKAPGLKMAVSCSALQLGAACSEDWGLVCQDRRLLVVGQLFPSVLASLCGSPETACSLVLANNLDNISCLTGAHLTLRWSGALWAHLELGAGAPALTREHS